VPDSVSTSVAVTGSDPESETEIEIGNVGCETDVESVMDGDAVNSSVGLSVAVGLSSDRVGTRERERDTVTDEEKVNPRDRVERLPVADFVSLSLAENDSDGVRLAEMVKVGDAVMGSETVVDSDFDGLLVIGSEPDADMVDVVDPVFAGETVIEVLGLVYDRDGDGDTLRDSDALTDGDWLAVRDGVREIDGDVVTMGVMDLPAVGVGKLGVGVFECEAERVIVTVRLELGDPVSFEYVDVAE